MKIRTSAVAVAAALSLGMALVQPGLADSSTYVTQRRQIRCGVVISSALNMNVRRDPATGGQIVEPENSDPHIFYVMDARTDLRPAGFEYVNPLAPPTITGTIYQRWQRRVRSGNDPAFIAGNPLAQAFRVGARVTKNMGCYWEVNVDTTSPEDLQQFDLLFLTSHKANTAFPAEIRDKLRRYVDGGGTLWVEQCGGFTFARGAPFLFDVQFSTGGSGGGGGQAGAVIAAANHPLLNAPYVLSPGEVQGLGDKNVGRWYLLNPYDPANPGAYDPNEGLDLLNPPAKESLVPVVWNSRGYAAASPTQPHPKWRPYVIAGNLGAGRMIYTAQDSGCAINDYVGGVNAGYGGNSGAISGDTLVNAKPADLRFAYNMSAWAVAHRTAYTDVRRSGGTTERIASALEQRWQSLDAGAGATGGAVYYKRAVFAVGGDLVLRCFNASPGADLDNSGSPDMGLLDYIAGAGRDVVWELDLKAFGNGVSGASTPTVIEFYDPSFTGAAGALLNFQQRELVVVTLSDGTVVAARAFPRTLNASGQMVLASTTVADWVLPSGQTHAQDFGLPSDLPVPSPAWSEGILFVPLRTSSGGRIAAIDPRNCPSSPNMPSSAFHLNLRPGDGPVGGPWEAMVPEVAGTEGFWGSPTVGYVRDDVSGAMDKMLYVYAKASSTNIPSSFRAIPFGAVGEPLTLVSQPDRLYRSRARTPWFEYRGAVADGDNPLLRARVTCRVTSAAGSRGSTELAPVASGTVPGIGQFVTKFDMGEARVIIGSQLNVFMENPDGSSGTVTIDVNNPGVYTLAFYADYTLDWAPAAGGPVVPRVNARTVLLPPDPGNVNHRFGGPAALSRDDLLYYGADTSNARTFPGKGVVFAVHEQGGNQTRVRWSYIMHDAYSMTVNNQTMSFPPRLVSRTFGRMTGVQMFGSMAVHNGVAYAVARGVDANGSARSLLLAFRANPDFVLRLNQAIEPGSRIRIRQPNLYVDRSANPDAWIELTTGQYTVDYESGLIRITAMAPPGAVTANFASASMPFVVQVAGGAERVLLPERVDPDGGRRGGPDGVDNLIWWTVIADSSLATDQLLFVTSSPSVQNDVVWLGVQGSRGGYVVSYPADPSVIDSQFQGSGAEYTANPLWAQLAGTEPIRSAPVAVDNVLLASSSTGLFAFEDNLTLIADSKRLIEVNAAGEATWVCDGTRSYSVVGGNLTDYTDPINPVYGSGVPAIQAVPFARPSVVRRMSAGTMMVVDTGNNRVVTIDRGGNVQWEISRIQDQYKGLLRPGDPLDLNEPTDCTVWQEASPNFTVSGAFTHSGPAYITHYLIADSGNFRVIEVIDVYDTAGRPVMVRQLNYVSSTLPAQGKRYRYRSVQRLVMRNSDLPANPPSWRANPYDRNAAPLPIRYLTLASVTNMRAVDPQMPMLPAQGFGDSAESGGGSLMMLQEAGAPLAVVANLRIPDAAGPRVQPIVAPTHLSTFREVENNEVVVKFLLADANGVYQARLNFVDHTTNVPPYVEAVLDVEWVLTAEDYYGMTGKRLHASSVARLARPAGNSAFPMLRQFLVTNRFTGEDNPSVFGAGAPYFNPDPGNPAGGNISGSSEFHGEVFVLNPSTFSFAPGHGYVPDYMLVSGVMLVANPQASIVRRIPAEAVPTPGAQVGAVRRTIGSPDRATFSSLLEQPSFADRPN